MIDTVEPFALCIASAVACKPNNHSNLLHSTSTEGNWPFRPRMAGLGRLVGHRCHQLADRSHLVAERRPVVELPDQSCHRQTWPWRVI